VTHRERTEPEWVDTWVCTPQPTEPANLPPPPFAAGGRAFAGTTLRQTVRASIGGHRVRLCLSNAFGGTALPVTAVSVALPAGGRAGVSAIRPATSRPVTFGGRPSVRVPAGGQVASDPLELGVAAGSNLAVTMYLAGGQPAAGVTSHPGSRTTSYLLAGEHLRDPDLPGATPTDHWYFLSGLQVPAPPRTAVAVMVGDSLTDGRGSTTNQNNRWPDRLFDRLQSTPDTGDVAVLNHGVGGSRLLDDGQGPGTLDRLVAGVLARPALRWLVLFTGVNDIGTAEPTQAAQRRVAAELVAALRPDRHPGAPAGCRGLRRHAAAVRRQRRVRRSGQPPGRRPAAGQRVDPHRRPPRRRGRLRPGCPRPGRPRPTCSAGASSLEILVDSWSYGGN
jgi:hypothetical protein